MKAQKTAISNLCTIQIQGVKDTQDLLSGKWKTVIIAALYNNEKFRFMDLSRHIEGISPKVLSKELKDLELNELVQRTVVDTMPITVEYRLTPQGRSLNKIVDAMAEWGINYRNNMKLS